MSFFNPALYSLLAEETKVTQPTVVRRTAEGVQIGDEKRRIIRGTAELIWRFKKALHKTGYLDFELPPGGELPLYFLPFFALLELRSKKWRVYPIQKKGGITSKAHACWRVEWLCWMNGMRHRRK